MPESRVNFFEIKQGINQNKVEKTVIARGMAQSCALNHTVPAAGALLSRQYRRKPRPGAANLPQIAPLTRPVATIFPNRAPRWP